MPDFRVADSAPEHRKLRAAGLAAAGLWALAGAYAMRELTDGWVPEYWVQTWPAGSRQAATLVSVGLWRKETRHSLPGYAFHDWTGYQRPAEKIHEDRVKSRERAARSRKGAGARNGARTAARADEPAAERAPHVRPESHDSLPLPLGGGDMGRSGASQQRADDLGEPRPIPFPDGWAPHAGHVRTAHNRGVNLEHQAAQFAAHATANGRTAVDWDAAFTAWLGTSRPGKRVSPTSENTTDANIAALLGARPPGPRNEPGRRAIGGT